MDLSIVIPLFNESESIIELNWNESFNYNDIEFVCLPARHFSGRGPLNRNSTLWSSWAIKSKIGKIYFSGDSGYGAHFKKIGQEHGPFDFSLIAKVAAGLSDLMCFLE